MCSFSELLISCGFRRPMQPAASNALTITTDNGIYIKAEFITVPRRGTVEKSSTEVHWSVNSFRIPLGLSPKTKSDVLGLLKITKKDIRKLTRISDERYLTDDWDF